MMPAVPEGREWIERLSREIVAEFAPEELPLFDELAQETFEHPRPPQGEERGGDDPLGFGMNETLVAITPAVSAMVSAAFAHLLGEVFKAAGEEEAKNLRERIKRLVNKERSAAPLTVEQLAQVRKLAQEQAQLFGVPAGQAQQLADALVGRLALAR